MLRLSYRGKGRARSVGLPNWAVGLVAAGGAAVGIAIFLVVSTLALLLLPIVLIAGGVAAYMMRRRIESLLRAGGFSPETMARASRPKARRSDPRADIEDAEFRVVDTPREKQRQP